MTTTGQITAQIKRLLVGNPSYNIEIKNVEIKTLVVQTINAALKTEKLSSYTSLWDNIPNGVMIATYSNIHVQSYGKRSLSTLPCYPINLPKNMGIWNVSDENFPDIPFIPISSGRWGIVNTMSYLPNLSGLIGYENEGLNIIYTSDITKKYPSPVTGVRVKLLISDISTLTEDDFLPIPADMEASIINQVFNTIIHEPIYTHFNDGKDPRSNANRQQ